MGRVTRVLAVLCLVASPAYLVGCKVGNNESPSAFTGQTGANQGTKFTSKSNYKGTCQYNSDSKWTSLMRGHRPVQWSYCA